MLTTLTDNWDLVRTGFGNTIKLFVVSGLLALVIGTALAALRVSPVPALRAVGTTYVNLLRNTPLTLVFAFTVFGLPRLDVRFSFFTFAVLALAVYTAAFVCEAVRSGINTVPVGQAEAARALGMTFPQVLQLVVMPQALRAVVPPLASVIIALVKNTTIAAGFSVAEAGRIRAALTEPDPRTGVTYDQLDILIWVAVFFVLILIPLSLTQQRLERRWRVSR